METSHSPRTVLSSAYDVGDRIWPDHRRRCSRHDFTLPQLFACLVLREMLGLSYRGTEDLLDESPDWLAAIGLSKAPDHNTLWRALGKLITPARFDRLLDLMGQEFREAGHLKTSTRPLTIDSTCYEPHHRSGHYDRVCRKRGLAQGQKYDNAQKNQAETPQQVNRQRSRAVRRMPKLSLAVFSASHVILAARAHIGNGSDMPDFPPLLREATRRARVKAVVADAGYDSEANHRFAREQLGVRSIIPPTIGRRSDKPPRGRYRRAMKQRFSRKADKKVYGQRAQSETVNSMMKRNFGDALRSIKPDRRKKEMLLRALTHNIMLLANQKKD